MSQKKMRKYLKYIAVIFVVVTVICLFYPKKGITGIDVSHHNDNVHEYVENNEVNYIIDKASEGTTLQDEKYEEYRQLAKDRKILFGAYHFLNFTTSAREQFANFKKVANKHHLDLKPVLDVELYGKKLYPEKEHLQILVKEFGELCHNEYGCYPIIYCNEDFKIRYFLTGFSEYPIWICNYVTNNINGCDMQQYKIDREHNIDLNKIYDIERVTLYK